MHYILPWYSINRILYYNQKTFTAFKHILIDFCTAPRKPNIFTDLNGCINFFLENIERSQLFMYF